MEPEEQSSPSSRDAELDEIIASYLEAVDRGNPVDNAEWLKRHPEYASELSQFFANHDAAEAVLQCRPKGLSRAVSSQAHS